VGFQPLAGVFADFHVSRVVTYPLRWNREHRRSVPRPRRILYRRQSIRTQGNYHSLSSGV